MVRIMGETKSRIDHVIMQERDKPGREMLGKALYEKLTILKRERARII
jgi:hypothetical protein